MSIVLRRVLHVALAVAASAITGCSMGDQLLAGRSEYELYRTTRLAPTLEERLAAGNRYLKSEPDGRFAKEVKAWFAPAEEAYVGAAWNSLPRLRAYVAALPDGPSIERVKARTEELEATIEFGEKRERQRRSAAAAREANLDRAAEQRQAFLDELGAWIRAFVALRSWDKPLAELSPEMQARLGGAGLGDSCLEELCSKAFAPRFAIPIRDKIVPREAAYTVELVLREGVVVEARLRGRELFSRLGEALDRRAVSFSDPQSRAEGIGRALGFVTDALGDAYLTEACERPAVSPVVLERACEGSRVVATAALEAGDDDRLVFSREAPSAEEGKAPAPAKSGTSKPAAGAKKQAP